MFVDIMINMNIARLYFLRTANTVEKLSKIKIIKHI